MLNLDGGAGPHGLVARGLVAQGPRPLKTRRNTVRRDGKFVLVLSPWHRGEFTGIPSNMPDGAGRFTDPDFRRFLWHSFGSCNELEYDLLLPF
jgi:hypothetical protein